MKYKLNQFALLCILEFVITSASYSQNLLKNGSFESDTTGWSISGATIDKSVKYQGAGSLKLSGHAVASQKITIQPYHTYQISFAVKLDNVSGFTSQYIDIRIAGNNSSYFYDPVFLRGTADWKIYSCRMLMGHDINLLTLSLKTDTKNGMVWYDSVRISEVVDSSKINFSVNMSETVKTFNPALLSTNVGPIWGRRQDFTGKFKEIGMNMVRTHDQGGPCDIHTIFPDLSRDPLDSTAYNFQSSDANIAGIINAGSKVWYRLGESWGWNAIPLDFDKWAQVALQIVKHYNAGWNKGFHYDISYWEIWNEPNLKILWNGTPAQYYSLYRKTVEKIKAYDNKLKVGGPAIASGDINFSLTFLDSVTYNHTPLDFFSYHMYNRFPFYFGTQEATIHNLLADRGLNTTKTCLTEWNTYCLPTNRDSLGGDDAYLAAQTASSVIAMQNSTLDKAHYYCTAHGSIYFGLMRKDGNYAYSGLVFNALGRFNLTPTLLSTSGGDGMGVDIIAGTSADKNTVNILVSNNSSKANGYRISLTNLPSGIFYTYNLYRINADNQYLKVEVGTVSSDNASITEVLKAPFVDHIVLKRQLR
jgi:xylan 1,4-beta-xylosidase